MSITKEKVDNVIATLGNHTSNNANIRQLLGALRNVLRFQVRNQGEITLEKFIRPIYGHLGNHVGIDNWAMLEPISRLINKHFYEDIFTFESYRQFINKPTQGNEGEQKLWNKNNEDYSIFLKPGVLEKPITTTSPNFPTPSSRIPPKTNTLAETRKKNESDVDEDMLELMREARANGWGQTKPKLESVRSAPLLRQETISNLPEKEWIDAEVLTATMGSDEDTTSPYVDEIRGILSKPLTDYLEPGEKVTVGNENEIATRQLKDAAITARKRRYKEEGRSSNSKYLKYNFKFNDIVGGRRRIEGFPVASNTLTNTGCYIRQNTDFRGNSSNIRSEAIILYKDKPIMGVNRIWLIEFNKRNGRSRIVRQNITRPYMNQLRNLLTDLVEFENSGTFQGRNGEHAKDEVIRILRQFMRNGFSIIDIKDEDDLSKLGPLKKQKHIIYIDKDFNQCVNLGGKPNPGESGREAFDRELLEETGFNINNPAHLMGSRYYCIGTKAQVDLTTAAHDILVRNYINKYKNNDTEIQSLFHGNVCIAGSNIGSSCNNVVPEDYIRNVTVNGNNYTRGIYLKKYLKYKKKYLELKSKINNIN